MIKTAFQNYIKHIKWLLLIILIVGGVIGVLFAVIYFGVLKQIQAFDEAIYVTVLDYIKDYFLTLSIQDTMSADFLKNFVSGLVALVSDLGTSLKVASLVQLGVCVLLILGAIKLTEMLAKRAMRKSVNTKYTKTGIGIIILKLAVSLITTVAYAIIVYFWFFALYLLPLISQIIKSYESLYITWRVHFRQFDKKKIINIKNVMSLSISKIVMLYTNFAVIILVSLLNITAAVLLAFPLFTYNSCVGDITSRGYFKKMYESGNIVTLRQQNKQERAAKKKEDAKAKNT